MKFIYTTDLHGDIKKYQDVLRFAEEQEVKLIHLGADLLPKGSGILGLQKKFVNGFLQSFYSECRGKGIEVMAFFGNDDIYTRKKYFRKYADLLDEKTQTFEGYEFKAYGFVPDVPFGLKQACKIDHPGWKLEETYFQTPTDVNENGFFPIGDVEGFFADRGTIEGDLKGITADTKTIMAIHTPPMGLGLDVCHGNRQVGSKAVTDWVEREKPAVLLSGHIHESYKVSGMWRGLIGSTLVIQPGQMEDKTNLVLVEVGRDVDAHLVEISGCNAPVAQ